VGESCLKAGNVLPRSVKTLLANSESLLKGQKKGVHTCLKKATKVKHRCPGCKGANKFNGPVCPIMAPFATCPKVFFPESANFRKFFTRKSGRDQFIRKRGKLKGKGPRPPGYSHNQRGLNKDRSPSPNGLSCQDSHFLEITALSHGLRYPWTTQGTRPVQNGKSNHRGL